MLPNEKVVAPRFELKLFTQFLKRFSLNSSKANLTTSPGRFDAVL